LNWTALFANTVQRSIVKKVQSDLIDLHEKRTSFKSTIIKHTKRRKVKKLSIALLKKREFQFYTATAIESIKAL